MKKQTNTQDLEHPVLKEGPQGLELLLPDETPGTGVRMEVDWLRHALRRGSEHLRGDPLARALGTSGVEKCTIADATAGLGGDALLLATLGHRVLAFERNTAIYSLLQDGLTRLAADSQLSEIASRIELRHGDACELLLTLTPAPDFVYIDPMFPPKRRESALPPKALQRLRQVVGSDQDAGALLSVALRVAARRVIVKRPNDADPLSPGLIASYTGKTVHYDAYHPARKS